MLGKGITTDDLKDCAIWPGRVNRNGRTVTPFLTLEEYMDVVEQIKWCNHPDGYHLGNIPQQLRSRLGEPCPGSTRPWKCYAHQLIYRLANGAWPNASIDHIDNCRQRNIPKNLRAATSRVQSKNRKSRADGRERGVAFHKSSGKWQVAITDARGIKRYYGGHETVGQANSIAAKVHAENAREVKNECGMIAATEIPAKRDLPVGVFLGGNPKSFRSHVQWRESGRLITCHLGTYATVAKAAAAVEAARTLRKQGCRDKAVLKQAAKEAAMLIRKEEAAQEKEVEIFTAELV